MNIVVTGYNGFAGQHLLEALHERWPQAAVYGWDLPEVDITQPDTYRDDLKEIAPQWIVHLAALADVGASFNEADRYHAVNVEGTRRVLETVESVSPDTRVLVVSSSDIYGETEAALAGTPVSELPLEACRPRSPYGESKLAMERMIVEEFSERCVRVRPFAHIGPGQQRGFVTADFASQIVAIERGEQEPILRVGNLKAQRDFTDVRDTVRAYRLLMERAELGAVYNVASGQAVSIQSILDRLLTLSPAAISVETDPERMRPSDISRLVGDAGTLVAATGWEPQISLEQSLTDILDYWRGVGTDEGSL